MGSGYQNQTMEVIAKLSKHKWQVQTSADPDINRQPVDLKR